MNETEPGSDVKLFARLIRPRVESNLKDDKKLKDYAPVFQAWTEITAENRKRLREVKAELQKIKGESGDIDMVRVGDLPERIDDIEASVSAAEELIDERLEEMFEDPEPIRTAFIYYSQVAEGELNPYTANYLFVKSLEDA